jgi:hypothetical protein
LNRSVARSSVACATRPMANCEKGSHMAEVALQ